jgi:hypothetical protein
MREHVCQIYILYDEDGVIDYVGRTNRKTMKRMYEHKAVLGFMPKHEIVDACSTDCRNVEKKWIDHYRNLGFKLRNINYGQGPHYCSEETRKKLSEKFTGRPVTWADKISATQKGVKKNWSPEGEERIKATRFKKGRNSFALLSPERQEQRREKYKEVWRDPERAKRMASGRINDAWSKLSPDRQSEISEFNRQKIKNQVGLAKLGGEASQYKKDPKIASRNATLFWEDLRKDPVRYREYIDRRAESIRVAREAKRNLA